MPAMVMEHIEDPRDKLLKEIGSLNDIQIFNNQVLIAIYQWPEKTKSGLYLPDSNRAEDIYQGKVGLIIKQGTTAFEDPDGRWFQGAEIGLNDWVVFRPSDGWALTVNKIPCRMLDDTAIRGVIQH